ncbi:aromatic-ring-hydroxylating dioxygenase subunit beta [Rhodococcus koreensis]
MSAPIDVPVAGPDREPPASDVSRAVCDEVRDWMYRESELLDDGDEREWLKTMVSEDVVYRVPLRQTVERARGAGWVEGVYHLDENYRSLDSRVLRNETAFAWAEDPPSRIRHFVTNVRVRRAAEGAGEDVLAVRTNQLIYRTRQDNVTPQILSADRRDVLRREAGALRLVERTVLLDLTVIGTHNLSIFF